MEEEQDSRQTAATWSTNTGREEEAAATCAEGPEAGEAGSIRTDEAGSIRTDEAGSVRSDEAGSVRSDEAGRITSVPAEAPSISSMRSVPGEARHAGQAAVLPLSIHQTLQAHIQVFFFQRRADMQCSVSGDLCEKP